MPEGITGRQYTDNTKAIAGLGKTMERVEKVIGRSPWSGEEKPLTFRWSEDARGQGFFSQQAQAKILQEEVPKAAVPQGAAVGAGITGGAIVSGLAKAGAFTKGADALNSIFTPHITSNFGDEAGTITSSVIDGIGMGATIGAFIPGPLPVTVLIGGVVGGAVGFLTGLAKNFEKENDAFKDYYKSQYETVTQNRSEALQRGITLAGGENEEYTGVARQKETLEAARERYLGEGYVAERTPGLEEQNEWLEGEGGPGMKDAYAMIGRFQAAQENKKESLEREALNAVMSGGELEQYQENGVASAAGERLLALREQYEGLVKSNDVNAGAQMGALLAEAQVIANNEYNASKGAQEMLDANLSLIANIRENSQLKDEYFSAGYLMGQEFTKGLGMKIAGTVPGGTESGGGFVPDPVTGGYWDMSGSTNIPTLRPGGTSGGYWDDTENIPKWKYNAWGLNRVPYDNFPALLHEGERVLTAREARQQDGAGVGVSVQVTGPVNIREEADIEKVAHALAREIVKAKAVQAPK